MRAWPPGQAAPQDSISTRSLASSRRGFSSLIHHQVSTCFTIDGAMEERADGEAGSDGAVEERATSTDDLLAVDDIADVVASEAEEDNHEAVKSSSASANGGGQTKA